MKIKKKIIGLSMFLVVLLLPLFFVEAQGLVPCGQGREAGNACTLCHLIVGINGIVQYGTGLLITVAAVAIFISGVMYVVSGGSEGQVTLAKNFLTASLKGFTLVLGAWFIVNVVLMWILSFNVETIQKVNWYTFDCSTATSTTNDARKETNTEPSAPQPSPPTTYVDCVCANLSPLGNYSLIGEVTKVPSKEHCWSTCNQRNAHYYRLGSENEYTAVQEGGAWWE
jgi:hypothetical protein